MVNDGRHIPVVLNGDVAMHCTTAPSVLSQDSKLPSNVYVATLLFAICVQSYGVRGWPAYLVLQLIACNAVLHVGLEDLYRLPCYHPAGNTPNKTWGQNVLLSQICRAGACHQLVLPHVMRKPSFCPQPN